MLLERITAIDGAAVVYVTRQETAEEVATFLAKNGVSARAYHAGLPDEFRADELAGDGYGVGAGEEGFEIFYLDVAFVWAARLG